MALLNIPFIQQQTAAFVSRELSKVLHTEVHIGGINMGLLNRMLVEDLWIDDQRGDTLLKADRLSARFELLPLLNGKVTIHKIQLFGLKLQLQRESPEAMPNYQFVLDALASKDSVQRHSDLNLRINSVLVRNGHISYAVRSEPETEGVFNPSHLQVENLRANISLKALTNDSINATVRQLSFDEHSGFHLQQLALKLTANKGSYLLSHFELNLPKTHIKLDSISGHHPVYSTDKQDTLIFQGGISDSYLTPSDLTCFAPVLAAFHDRLHIRSQFSGGFNYIKVEELSVASDNRDVAVQLNGVVSHLADRETTLLQQVISHIQISESGTRFLFRNLTGDNSRISPLLLNLGSAEARLEVNGPVDYLSTHGVITTSPGKVETHLVLDSSKNRAKGLVETDTFHLGQLLGDEHWGDISFNVEVDGKVNLNNYPDGTIRGHVSSIEYNKYTYHDITIDGYSVKGGYDGLLTLNDANVNLYVYGSFNRAQEIPAYNLTAKLRNFRPHKLNLSDKYEYMDISMNITADFSGNTLDNIKGSIDLDSLLMIAPIDYYFMENLHISSEKREEKRSISITSDFVNGNIEGRINFATLPQSIGRLLHTYLPSLVNYKERKRASDNNFSFDITLDDTDLFSKLLYVPIVLRSASTLKGYLNDNLMKMKVEGYFPHFDYDGKRYESGLLLCENREEEIRCRVRTTRRLKDQSSINLSIDSSAREDELKTNISWGNNAEVTYSGKVAAVINFWKEKAEDKYLLTKIEIEPSHIILNDTVWNLHKSQVKIDSGYVYVDKFVFEHDDQYLKINGSLTDNLSDTLIVDLKKIRIEYVFDILQFHPVDFKGSATGKAFINNLFKEPQMEANLSVEHFAFNDGYMGNMQLLGRWDKERGIYLDADIREPDLSRTTVQGFVSPNENGLDLAIRADSSNLYFLNTYVEGIFDDVKGRTSGDIHLYGPFSELNIEGDVIADGSFYVDALNAHYTLRRDSVKLRYNQFVFDDVKVYDHKGHQGTLNGVVNHDHLNNISYDIHIDMDNVLVYNGKEDDDLSFYGTVYGTGESYLRGNSETLTVDIVMQTEENTTFVYNSASPEEITDNEFITFVDRTPKREIDLYKYGYQRSREEEEVTEIPMDIRLNLQVDVNPNASIKVIMDPVSGDYITTMGSGTLRANYYNKGDFRMYGTYTMNYGLYKLSLQEVIRKEFLFREGGTVTFSGNPYDGILNLQAVYTVPSVSLNDLVAGTSFTQSTVRVNCIMNLSGRIFSPDIGFDIELPTVNEEERELVRSYISTDEQMEMQIIYLLGIGRFYTYDYTSNSDSNSSGSSSTMSSLLSTTLSGQLNNMLTQVINSNQWNLGTNLSTGNKGWTDMEVEGILSGRLLNNRLLINGQFGYRENALANTNFVGDFDVQWLLTPSGEISLKGYNQTNDRYFTKTTLNTQGIGIIFKKDFDRWAEIIKKKKSTTQPADSLSVQKPKAQQKREMK